PELPSLSTPPNCAKLTWTCGGTTRDLSFRSPVPPKRGDPGADALAHVGDLGGPRMLSRRDVHRDPHGGARGLWEIGAKLVEQNTQLAVGRRFTRTFGNCLLLP